MEPIRILYWEGLFLFVLLVAVLCRLVFRRQVLLGLVMDPSRNARGRRRISFSRFQLLAVTLAFAGWYLWELARSTVEETGGAMPRVGGWWLGVFGASGSLYAAVKAWKVLRRG